MTRFISSLVLLMALLRLHGQPGAIDHYYPLLRAAFNENACYNSVAFIEPRWRIAGNSGFNETIYHVEKILLAAGYKKQRNDEPQTGLSYRIESRKMEKPTWEPVDSKLTIVGEQEPLLQFSTNRNMLAINSASTGPEGITAEVVYVGNPGDQDPGGMDLEGKIVFGDANAPTLYSWAIPKGAIGIIAYSIPAFNQPETNTNVIQFQAIPFQDSLPGKWGIMLSWAARKKLLAALSAGPVRVKVQVDAKIYRSTELTLVANVAGTVKPRERFVFSAHVQEPGANDNATGVATLAEMARVTAKLVKGHNYNPLRTITFIWGDEIIAARRYINEDSSRAKGIRWGLSLDMVGEDPSKTGGSFLVEKMPDPSAIWTRGNDRHTEWGGAALSESDLFPHYFNDFLLNRCRQQATENGWVVNANPYEGGSDHEPFLEAKIPGLLMWHFTDVYYHTDADRLDKVSAKEMRNVGISGLAAAFTLAAADEQNTLRLIRELGANALERLAAEYALSKTAIQHDSAISAEQQILGPGDPGMKRQSPACGISTSAAKPRA
jgi:aminopeptidase YwaD